MIRLTILSALLAAGHASAQACLGPTTGIPSIGQTTTPPASSGPIDVSYTGQFSVPRTGVYEITGHVTLGRGAGAPVTITQVQASVDGRPVVDESPPPIDGPNPLPNGWTYNWSIYYWSIHKPFATRRLLEEGQSYSVAVAAQGSYQVLTPYHRRNYGVQLSARATYCGPAAAVRSIGTGCIGATAPTLQSPATPVLGQQRDVMITGAPNSVAVAMFGFPTLTPTYIGASCNVYLDLNQPLMPLPAPIGGSGIGFAIYQIPPNPSLASVRLHVQGVVVAADSPLGIYLSNALELTLGF